MNSNEIVKLIRSNINKLNPSLSFQHAEIWKNFTLARSRVYKNEIAKGNKLPELAYHTFCIELTEVDDSCPCLIDNCIVKQTKYQIPSYMHVDAYKALKLFTNKGKPIAIANINTIEGDIAYKPGYKNRPVALISNGFLYIYNIPTKFEEIRIRGIFSNPLDILFIQKCDGDNCLQDNKDLLIISEEQLLDMINITMGLLDRSLQVPSDNTGDNNEKV